MALAATTNRVSDLSKQLSSYETGVGADELDFEALTFGGAAPSGAESKILETDLLTVPASNIEQALIQKETAEMQEEPIISFVEVHGSADLRTSEDQNNSVIGLENGHIASKGEIPTNGIDSPNGNNMSTENSSNIGSPQGPLTPRRMGTKDFEILAVIGQGSWGKVFQVRRRDSGDIYAMKVMKKKVILEKNHSEYIRAESHIMQKVAHPFIITLRYAFTTDVKLYLVMDFINGGHLFYNLNEAACFSTSVARFFTAEIVSAVSHLHSLGIVHRDLKPENVLVGQDGHLRITDFGLAKEDMKDDIRSNSFIGAIEYMAPEIIQSKGHNKAVDWWSVGILLYEMLHGHTPFSHKNTKTLQKQIIGGKLKTCTWIDNDARDLIKNLLHRDPAKRIGQGPDGSKNIKNHKFFKTINWRTLEAGEIESPFKPKINGDQMSIERFNKMFTDEAAVDSPGGTPAKHSHDAFPGFSYTEPSFLKSLQAEFDKMGLQ